MIQNYLYVFQVSGVIFIIMNFRKNIKELTTMQGISLVIMAGIAFLLLINLIVIRSANLNDVIYFIQAIIVIILAAAFWKEIKQLRPMLLIGLAMLIVVAIPCFLNFFEGFSVGVLKNFSTN